MTSKYSTDEEDEFPHDFLFAKTQDEIEVLRPANERVWCVIFGPRGDNLPNFLDSDPVMREGMIVQHRFTQTPDGLCSEINNHLVLLDGEDEPDEISYLNIFRDLEIAEKALAARRRRVKQGNCETMLDHACDHDALRNAKVIFDFIADELKMPRLEIPEAFFTYDPWKEKS